MVGNVCKMYIVKKSSANLSWRENKCMKNLKQELNFAALEVYRKWPGEEMDYRYQAVSNVQP